MAAFKAVYSGSRSMRCAEFVGFVVFCDDGTEAPLSFVVVRGAGVG